MECGNERAVMTQSNLISVLMEKESLTHEEAMAVVKIALHRIQKSIAKR